MPRITITCPHCGISKEVAFQQIPENSTNIKCQNCQQTFPMPEQPQPEPQQTDTTNLDVDTIPTDAKFCSTCGKKVHLKAEICPKCGVRLPPPANSINKVALLLTTVFLGGIGGHRFYQRKYLLGTLYLLFFWTYIPTLVSWIEFIIYACKSEASLQEKYPEVSGSGPILVMVIGFFGIAMIGILAAIAIPQFSAYRMKAYNATAQHDLTACRTEVESYRATNSTYPTQPDQLQCTTSKNVALYYLPLGPDEYQLISYHDQGDKAFLRHSSSQEIEEDTQEEIEGFVKDNFGPDALGLSFRFLQ